MLIPTIKVVSNNCNLACRYCYYEGKRKSNKVIMGKDILKSIIKSFLYTDDTEDNIHFVWHGGEPLLAGIEFYEQVIKFQKKFNLYNKKINNGIQTNATLINENWVKFLIENKFNVGVSVDGPIDIHNANRITKNNKGSFKEVLNGLKILQKFEIYPNVIAVITKTALNEPENIFNFFIENNINNFHPKPCYELDKNGNLMPFSITPDEFTDFLIKLFDLWMKTNNQNIIIRNLYHIMLGLMGGHPKLCEFDGRCQLFITIEYDGMISACDSFPIKKYYIGNIYNNSLKNILNSTGYKKFLEDIHKNKLECVNCEWWNICHGGCLRYSYSATTNKWQKNIFCHSKKRLFSYISERIKEIENS